MHQTTVNINFCSAVLTTVIALSTLQCLTASQKMDVIYGVDVSFPTHSSTVSTNYAWLLHNVDPENNPTPKEFQGVPIQPLGNRQEFYDEFLEGCREYYKERGTLCDSTERDRLIMSISQPQSMQNYTDIGFKKIRAPDELYKLLKDYWDKNHDDRKKEKWNAGNTYTNHWAAPTYMVSVEDTGLRGGGGGLKNKIWNAAKAPLEEWTGQELTPSSLYGIRVYTEGAVLAPHVDRMPLISSAIVNVAQDVDEDWPIEVIGRDGRAYNVTMKPGDMVLYESHSTIHARPFPLKGRYYANIFIHFEPTGHSLRHGITVDSVDIHKQYTEATANSIGGHENTNLPLYIKEGTTEAKKWIASHRKDWEQDVPSPTTVVAMANHAAQVGDMKKLSKIAKEDRDKLYNKDENGWRPIHEGARNGHKDVVELLVKHGADFNERSGHGVGGTPLHLAMREHGINHPVIEYLKSIGAVNIGPEL